MSKTAYDVSVKLVRGGHDLNGSPIFFWDSCGKYNSADIDPKSFSLEGGQTRTVSIKLREEDFERGICPLVAFTLEKNGTALGNLMAWVLVKPSVDSTLEAHLSDVQVSQSIMKGVDLAYIVENIGNTHFRPNGKVIIYTPHNEKHEIAIPTGIVLPGYARQFATTWVPTEKDVGTYKAIAFFEISPGCVLRQETEFELIEPFVLGQAALEIDTIKASCEEDSIKIRFSGSNTGNINITPTANARISSLSGSILSELALNMDVLQPGEEFKVETELPYISDLCHEQIVVSIICYHAGKPLEKKEIIVPLAKTVVSGNV
ncbi:MAG: hypothetical protein ACOYD6_02290 [Limnochordia bacterium]